MEETIMSGVRVALDAITNGLRVAITMQIKLFAQSEESAVIGIVIFDVLLAYAVFRGWGNKKDANQFWVMVIVTVVIAMLALDAMKGIINGAN